MAINNPFILAVVPTVLDVILPKLIGLTKNDASFIIIYIAVFLSFIATGYIYSKYTDKDIPPSLALKISAIYTTWVYIILELEYYFSGITINASYFINLLQDYALSLVFNLIFLSLLITLGSKIQQKKYKSQNK